MSPAEITAVQQSFPKFVPARVAPGSSTGPGIVYDPNTFAPPLFLGQPVTGATVFTPLGIEVETNGFDALEQPVLLPATGTYFDSNANPFQFQLASLDLAPLNKLEARMHVASTSGAPSLTIDRRSGRVLLADIDRILLAVQSSMAMRLPQVASVDIRRCRITIESTLFYVSNSNLGAGWAGGSTRDLGDGNFRIHLAVFFISGDSKVIVDSQMFLVDEAINFFALAIGRPDLGL
jgi:hypothetical protein